jgi:hypothetical protein
MRRAAWSPSAVTERPHLAVHCPEGRFGQKRRAESAGASCNVTFSPEISDRRHGSRLARNIGVRAHDPCVGVGPIHVAAGARPIRDAILLAPRPTPKYRHS